MSPDAARELAELLGAWKREQRVSFAHIARRGHIALNTLRYLFRGSRHTVGRETLYNVAVGLATDPAPPYDLDDDVLKKIVRELFAIAGYTPLDDETAAGLLERALLATGQSAPKARRLARLLRASAVLEDAAIDHLTALAERHRTESPATE